MTSEARVLSNRQNAQRSTGPRTEQGKQKVRLNALKHGRYAQSPVLPHEDAEAYQQRLEAWTRELSPHGAVGGYLAERAARLSWQLDRADACESARLARRIRNVPRERERSRLRRAMELVRQLLTAEETGQSTLVLTVRNKLERLESTAHGCLALLSVWESFETQLARPADSEADKLGGLVNSVALGMLRFLGGINIRLSLLQHDHPVKRVAELAEHAIEHAQATLAGPPECGPAGAYDDAQARRELLEIVAAEKQRLQELRQAHMAEAPKPAVEDAACCSFDHTAEGQRLQRYQEQRGRALLQTLQAIQKLNRGLAAQSPAPAEPETEPAPASTAEPANALEQSQAVAVNERPANDLRPAVQTRSRPRSERVQRASGGKPPEPGQANKPDHRRPARERKQRAA